MREKKKEFNDSSTLIQIVIGLKGRTVFMWGMGWFLCLNAMVVHSQPLPSDTWLVRNYSVLLDLGYGWKAHTLFKPYRTEELMAVMYQDDQIPDCWLKEQLRTHAQTMIDLWKNDPDKLSIVTWPGFLGQVSDAREEDTQKNFTSISLINQFHFRKWWAEWYIRGCSDPEALHGFTPRSRAIKRLGMNSGEYDQASISYRDKHFILQFGRGRQIWGPDLKNNLMLSAYSASYDHMMVQFRYKRFTGIFFTGFLESVEDREDNINRYIVGHGFQYSNHRNLLASLSEVTVYYGPDRYMDFGYMNPLIPHLEAELDDRENIAEGNYSNAVWIFTLDWLLAQHSRLSFTYLIDEFQLDQEDRDQKRPDATALQIRFAQSYVGEQAAMTVYGLYNRVGSYTFRHENPYTTFVSRELPLGIPLGSDFYAIKGGFRWSAPFPLLFELSYEHRAQGENNILQNLYVPYEEFTELPFPSGVKTNTKITSIVLVYSLNPILEMEMGYDFTQISVEHNGSRNDYFLYSRLIFQFPWFKSL